MKKALNTFWSWYERNYLLNIGIATGLFLLQIIHLVWLFGDVVILKLAGSPLFGLGGLTRVLLIVVDYTEIPALLSVSLVYLNELRHSFSWKAFGLLFALNIQWVHLFWITDEFVIDTFAKKIDLPEFVAWIAIGIDYLEVPVIVSTVRRFLSAFKARKVADFLQNELQE